MYPVIRQPSLLPQIVSTHLRDKSVHVRIDPDSVLLYRTMKSQSFTASRCLPPLLSTFIVSEGIRQCEAMRSPTNGLIDILRI